MNKITYELNHKLSQKIINEVSNEDWYREEIRKSNHELLEWGFEKEYL